MYTKLCLKPGENGTKKWLEIYGERLVAVRYRYDENSHKRYKTVELIVEERDWVPKNSATKPTAKPADRVGVRIGPGEKDLQEKMRRAGAIWRPRQKLWEIPYGQVISLGLESRIVWEP